LQLAALCLAVLAPLSLAKTARGATNGRLSFLQLSADAPALDIYVDGSRIVGGLAFGEASAYFGLPSGSHQMVVTAAGRLDALLASTVAVQDGASATIVLAGLINLNDVSPAAPPDEQFGRYIQLGDDAGGDPTLARLRILQVSPGSGLLDVRVDGPTSATLGSALAYGGLGVYTGLPAGTYTLGVFLAGSQSPLAQIPGVTLSAGSAYTIVLGGVVSGGGALQPFQAVRLTDLTGGAAQPLTSGCNQVILPLAAGSPITDVLLRVQDPDLVTSIWRFDNVLKTFRAGYFNDPTAPLDYAQTAASPEAAFICVSGNTFWNPTG
jgi:hypothetical protein